jgi:hypothetical protein
MSERLLERALAQLAKPGATLAPGRDGAFGVYPRGDRRRRPSAKLSAAAVRALEAEGAIAPRADGALMLSVAGEARVRRDRARADEAFLAQHKEVLDRVAIDSDGDIQTVRGTDPDPLIRRLAGLRGVSGRRWLEAGELAAASQLRRDWAVAQIGMVRGSDWQAAPIGAGPRGASNAQEMAMARRCDARRRESRRWSAPRAGRRARANWR